MKKLGKKLNVKRQTIQAYASCTCDCTRLCTHQAMYVSVGSGYASSVFIDNN